MKCDAVYLDWMEVEWIKELNSLAPNGYNLNTGGNKNKHTSDETKKKQSEAQKGKHVGELNQMYGKHHTEEAIKKISEAGRRPCSEETKKKITESNLGKSRSEETKQKISKSKKGKTTWMKGKHHTEEANKKNSEAHKGKPWTEARRRASEAQKGKNL